jgi:hypothetical protein
MNIGLGGGAASSMASGQSDADLDFASVQRDNPEHGVGETAGADVVDKQDRVGVAQLPAAVDHFLTAAVSPTPCRSWSATAAAAVNSSCAIS